MAAHKIPNVPKQNTEKGEFINNCRWYGLQTPGWKYKINYVSIYVLMIVLGLYKAEDTGCEVLQAQGRRG